MSTNPLEPAFWEALGIQPVIIDPEDSESIEGGFKEVAQRIIDYVEEIVEEEESRMKNGNASQTSEQ